MLKPAAVAIALLWPGASAAVAEPKLPAGVTCAQVQANYDRWSYLGRPVIRAWLRLNGYSRRDIVEAEKCLRGP